MAFDSQEVDKQEENQGLQQKKQEMRRLCICIGAGDKLVWCPQRRRRQMKFSSARAPEYLSPQEAR